MIPSLKDIGSGVGQGLSTDSTALLSDKFQFIYATTSQIGSQLLLASTSSNVLLGQGSEKAFNECLGVSNVFPSTVQVPLFVQSNNFKGSLEMCNNKIVPSKFNQEKVQSGKWLKSLFC